MTIDIGSAATDRGSSTLEGYTHISKDNPANASGKITSVEIWANENLEGCEVATFYNVSGDNFTTRDTHFIGNVTAGSKQTFSGLDITVETGDYIGIYWTVGRMERDISGGAGYWRVIGDKIPCTNETFASLTPDVVLSLYGTGADFIKSISGTFGFTGNVIRLPKITLLGVFSPTGTISSVWKAFKSLAGTFGLTGTSSFTFIKVLSGVLTFTSSLTVMIYRYWAKVTKAVGNWTGVSKEKDDCTKVNKEKDDWNKVDK